MKIRASFRTKLLLLMIVPLCVAQVVTLYAVMRTVEQDIQLRARDSLNTGAVIVNEFLAARAEQLRTSVGVLASDYGLKEAVATGDAITIRSVLRNHGRRVGADLTAILDLDGAPIVSTVEFGAARIADPARLISDSNLQPRESTAFVADTAYHVFSVPIRAPAMIGWVVLGFRIDADLVARVSELTGLDTSIVHTDIPPTTIVSSRDTAPSELELNSKDDVVYMANDGPDQSLIIQTAFVRGDETVLVVLQRSLREAMQPYVSARRGLIAFGASLLLFVAVAGAWFSTTIAKPLNTLAAAARRMISGDYDTNVEVRSDDEIGELASSFNAMQLAIAEREQRISHHALHDPLTDLPNRAKVIKILTKMIDVATRKRTTVTVLSMRLVRMGEISSTLGHSVTNELIRTAARHLATNLDALEVLGHTGTNEFVIVLPGQDTDAAMSYVDRIEGLLGSGVTLGQVHMILQTKTGIAEFPRHGTTAADLLRLAAIARTDAEASNERVRVYQLGREDKFQRRLRIINDLPAALRRGEIQVWYQPKISLPDGNVCGAEALVRWEHSELGFLQPDDFVPAAERSGTIVALTQHVIAEAVRECRRWEEFGHVLQVSVNLSARDLLDEYLPYYVMQVLKEHELPAERLTLEVTESSIMEDLNHAVAILECLRDIGVQISMDDFGTGHSSLAQIRNIPLHELKIDRTFVMSLAEDEHNDVIVNATVNLAHSMRLKVVAEGVEDIETMRLISSIGCEQAQGYFLSKPIPSKAFRSWLEKFKPVAFENRRQKNRAFADRSN